MVKLTLRERLLRFMQKNHTTTFIASGDLQRIVMQHTTYTPRTTVRRLQELYEEGKLEREIRKGHAWYRAASPCESCIAASAALKAFNNT